MGSNLDNHASDACIGCKLKQISFVLVLSSKKQTGLICFSFELKKGYWFDLFYF